MKHTPGPWIIETHHKGKGLHGADLQIWSNAEFIAVIPPSLVAKREANAALIASAPEMLKLLKQVERAFNVKNVDPLEAFDIIERIKHVIAKATSAK